MMWIVDILASELFWGLGVGHDGLDYLMAKWILLFTIFGSKRRV